MLKALLLLAGGYLVLVGLAAGFQKKLVFFPDPHLAATPEAMNLPFEEVRLQTRDGVEIFGWFIPGPEGAKAPAALFFHGNAGNISHRLEQVRIIHRLGLACLIVDYRGYGKSRGKPSEPGLYLDAAAAWEWLTAQQGIPPGSIVAWGRSLGGPVAAWLAANRGPGGLIVESSFTSLPELGQKLYPFLPVKLISTLRFPTKKYVQQAACPVLVVHSPQDEIVPYAFGRRLFEAANEPKRFLEISGGHNEGFAVSGERYERGVESFLKGVKGEQLLNAPS